MKPLRTGLAAGLLAGAVGAANKLVADWREGTTGSPRVVTGTNGKAPAKAIGTTVTGAVGSIVSKRAAKRAEANRPPWVVAPAPGVTVAAGAPPRPAPAPAPARRRPSLDQLRPPSAKSVGASVGKYAAKQAGRAITKAAADRVGKAIEVIEVLEKVVASASSEASSKPDLTPSSGPGATPKVLPPTANLMSVPVRPGPAEVPSSASAPEAKADAPAEPAGPPPTPRGTLVSVRKFERGPRVVVGPSVKPASTPTAEPEPEPATPAAPAEVATAPAAAAVVDAAETPPAPAAKKRAAKTKAAPKKAAAKRAPSKTKAAATAPAPDGDQVP